MQLGQLGFGPSNNGTQLLPELLHTETDISIKQYRLKSQITFIYFSLGTTLDLKEGPLGYIPRKCPREKRTP